MVNEFMAELPESRTWVEDKIEKWEAKNDTEWSRCKINEIVGEIEALKEGNQKLWSANLQLKAERDRFQKILYKMTEMHDRSLCHCYICKALNYKEIAK